MEEKNFFKGEWKEVEKLSEGSFGIVYKAVKEQYGVESYSAIKQIKIPQTDKDYSILRSQGMTQSDIEKSYDSQAKKWIEEIEFLNQFKDNENIVSIEDFEVLEREDKPGRTINIRMELLQNIDDHVMDRTITDKKVLKMASDILKALEECEEKNVVHRDIKPENVFVNSRGTYKLGDFGEAKSIEKTVSNMSKKGTENYMAPEIYKGERGSRSVDTYSLGIMLYKYFNNNRLPFIPDYPNQITFEDMENALLKRMNGEDMKPPVKASNNIARIILKACSYKPEDRYKSAMDFRNDIEQELRSITSPMKLFDFQEGEIEKDNSISDFDKTTGIFEDDTKIKSDLDRTTGIFDEDIKNEEQLYEDKVKPREIIERVRTKNIKVNSEYNQNNLDIKNDYIIEESSNYEIHQLYDLEYKLPKVYNIPQNAPDREEALEYIYTDKGVKLKCKRFFQSEEKYIDDVLQSEGKDLGTKDNWDLDVIESNQVYINNIRWYKVSWIQMLENMPMVMNNVYVAKYNNIAYEIKFTDITLAADINLERKTTIRDEYKNFIQYILNGLKIRTEKDKVYENNNKKQFGYQAVIKEQKPIESEQENYNRIHEITYEKHYCYGIEYVVPDNYRDYMIEKPNPKGGISNWSKFLYDNMEIVVKDWPFFTKAGAKRSGLRRLEEFDGILVNSTQEHLRINDYDIIKVTYYKDGKKNYVFYFNPDSYVYYIRFIIYDDSSENIVWKIVKSLKYKSSTDEKAKMNREEKSLYYRYTTKFRKNFLK